MIKVLFMGTPKFAARILEQLMSMEDIEILGVVCQIDQKVGRKQVLTYPEVKKVALSHNLKVYQPRYIKEDYQALISFDYDLIITCAYGQIIPTKLLDHPKYGAYNIHASLLPKLRGGAPIQRAIINGDKETGITLMKMVEKMDAGNIVSIDKVKIEDDYTYGDLEEVLMELGCKVIKRDIYKLIDVNLISIEQNDDEATFAKIILPQDEKINFNDTYLNVYNRMRGLIPNPCGYGICDGKKIKFWKVKTTDLKTNEENGKILEFIDGCLAIAIENKILLVEELQLEGKKRCLGKDFKNGIGKTLIGKKFS